MVTSESATSAQPNASIWSAARGGAIPWIWRITASYTWIWIAARVGWIDPHLQFVQGVSPGRLALGIVIAYVAYVLLKQDKVAGCSSVITFPLYIALWPLIAIVLLIYWAWRVASVIANRSQQLVWASAPPLMTLAVTYGSFSSRGTLWPLAAALLSGANVTIVLVSVFTWLFRPLAWVTGIVPWLIAVQDKYTMKSELPTEDELAAAEPQAKKKLEDFIDERRSGLDNTKKLPAIPNDYRDPIIVAGFTRKFLFAVVHTGALFACIHHAIQVRAGGGAYLSDVPAEGMVWLRWFHFAVMTLISGDTNLRPISEAASLMTIANAMAGMAYLVILVTAFSMLGKERAGGSIDAANKAVQERIVRIEADIVRAVDLANRHIGLSDAAVRSLQKMSGFAILDATEFHAVRGVALLHDLANKLQVSRKLQDAENALRLASIMTHGELAKLYLRSAAKERAIPASELLDDVGQILDGREATSS